MLENKRRTGRGGSKEISSILNDVYEFFICLFPVRLSLTFQHGYLVYTPMIQSNPVNTDTGGVRNNGLSVLSGSNLEKTWKAFFP